MGNNKNNMDSNDGEKEIVSHFYKSSGTLSTIVRSSSYGLIGVVWILSHESVSELKVFYVPLLMIVCSLMIDMFHYLWKTITEGLFLRQYRKKKSNKPTDYPKYISIGSWLLLSLKTLMMLLGFIFIIAQLFNMSEIYVNKEIM